MLVLMASWRRPPRPEIVGPFSPDDVRQIEAAVRRAGWTRVRSAVFKGDLRKAWKDGVPLATARISRIDVVRRTRDPQRIPDRASVHLTNCWDRTEWYGAVARGSNGWKTHGW